MSDLLNTENKVNLLFKQFEGVAQTAIVYAGTGGAGRKFTQEGKKSLSNVFQQDIFSEAVPIDLSFTLYDMHFGIGAAPDVSDSSWNTNPQDQTLEYIDLSAASFGTDLPLRFYKSVYLEPTQTTSQAWWLRDPSGDGTGSSDNNLLKDMIPFLYNDNDPNMYTPIVQVHDGASWVPQAQATPNGVNWVIDPATGILQLYRTTANLATENIDSTSTLPDKRPRISFIKYTGAKGAAASGGGGGAGTIKVGTDISSAQDVSTVLFDASGFDLSFNGPTVTVSNLGAAQSTSDLSYYFFDQPPAPTDGSYSLQTGGGSLYIDMSWNLPQQADAAVPFGLEYTYETGSSYVVTQTPGLKLPHFKQLCVEYRAQTGGWTDLSYLPTGTQDPLNRPQFPSSSSLIPPTVNKAHIFGTGPGPSDLSNTQGVASQAPYDLFNGQLQLGESYQFRIFLKNNGTNTVTDPIYGTDVSYNYLYIPSASGDLITLGSFGPPTAPSNLSFNNSGYQSLDVSGLNSNVSWDANTAAFTWPINPAYGVNVFYGIDISASADPTSKQMVVNRWANTPVDSSYETTGLLVNNFQEDVGSISLINWAPEHRYDASGLYMRNNVQDFSATLAYAPQPAGSATIISVRPTRTDVGAQASPLATTTFSGLPSTDVSLANAYPGPSSSGVSQSTLINNIYFFNPGQSTDFDLSTLSKFAANPTDNLVGTDISGVAFCYLRCDVSSSIAPPNTYDASSTAPAVGYLDASNLTVSDALFGLVAFTEEGSSATPSYLGDGYYLDVSNVSNLLRSVDLTAYPDMSNNGYEAYVYRVRQYNISGGVDVQVGGEGKYDLKVAQKPSNDITYTETSYNNITPPINNSFFGLKRPNPTVGSTSIAYTYDLGSINEWWKPVLNIAQSKLVYRRGQGSSHGAGDVLPTTPAANAWDSAPTKSVNPGVNYNAETWIDQPRQYSRHFTTAGGPQFTIVTDYSNNMLRPTTGFQETRDVSCGPAPGKQMWWDYTWDGDYSPAGMTALPADSVDFFAGSGGSGRSLLEVIPNSGPVKPPVQIDHTLDLSSVSMMWANGGFRPGNYATALGINNPYIDFSSSFYNPGATALRDYSGKLTTGYTYTPFFSAGQFWADNTTTSSTVGVSGELKFITFSIDAPLGTGKYSLGVVDSSGNDVLPVDPAAATGEARGIYVFHAEVLSGSTTSYPTFGQCYDGQIRYNAAQGFNSVGSFDPTSRNVSGVPSDIRWHIYNQTTVSSITTLEISLALANGTTGVPRNIGRVNVQFH